MLQRASGIPSNRPAAAEPGWDHPWATPPLRPGVLGALAPTQFSPRETFGRVPENTGEDPEDLSTFQSPLLNTQTVWAIWLLRVLISAIKQEENTCPSYAWHCEDQRRYLWRLFVHHKPLDQYLRSGLKMYWSCQNKKNHIFFCPITLSQSQEPSSLPCGHLSQLQLPALQL